MRIIIKVSCVALFILAGCAPMKEVDTISQPHPQEASKKIDHAFSITEKYWKLVKLNGQDVVMTNSQEREAHFILKTEGNRVTGYSGCNGFFGSYTITDGNRIKFSQLGSTRRACLDASIKEHEFLTVFSMADNYNLVGDTLKLNVGRRAPLAVFEAVYLQ